MDCVPPIFQVRNSQNSEDVTPIARPVSEPPSAGNSHECEICCGLSAGQQASDIVAIDPSQTMCICLCQISAPGTVSQVRASAQELTCGKIMWCGCVFCWACHQRRRDCRPTRIEHMVDCVSYILRAIGKPSFPHFARCQKSLWPH